MMFYGLEGGFLGEDIKVELGKIILLKTALSGLSGRALSSV